MIFHKTAMALALGWAFFVLCPPATAGKSSAVATIPLPQRAQLLPSKDYRSPSNFKKTLMFYKRYLKRTKQPFKQVPTYQARGILIGRLLSQAPQSPWLAIQVYKKRGQTQIFIVPRPAKNTQANPQIPKNSSAP